MVLLQSSREETFAMAKYTTENIHTVALVGHGGAGKTTLTEALLLKTGVIGAMGTTERGSTVADFDPLEKTYGHSLNTSIVNFPYQGIHVHLATPPACRTSPASRSRARRRGPRGHRDQRAERHRAEHDADDARAGKRGLDRMILINKIDAENVDLEALVKRIQEVFGKECLRSTCPPTAARTSSTASSPRRRFRFLLVKAAHSALIDQVVEVDEELMALYLEQGEELSPEQLHCALREGAARGPPDPDLLRLRRAPAPASAIPRDPREARAQRDREQSAALHQVRGHRGEDSTPSPIRRSTSSRTSSR
jgi:elongation factor G